MQISQFPRCLSFLTLFVFTFSIQGCTSSEKNRTQQQTQEAPLAMHHTPADSPGLPGAVRLMDGMGKIDFAITTKSKEAQAFFNQGVAQLYGFWFSEAEKSFLQAAKLDPGAAMAYWGIAMTATGNFVPNYQLAFTANEKLPIWVPPNSPEGRARDAIGKAQALNGAITPRERLYIEAVAAQHNPGAPNLQDAYVAAMRNLVKSFPDDLEAKAILALALENGYDPSTKLPERGTDESVKLLRQVLAKNPDHAGASHFLIHGLEGSKNVREALPIAARYVALVPNIPHALHMPGHVYAQVGMFDEAVKSFMATAAKEREYISADPRYSKVHYVHNELLLLHVLGSQGNYQEAISRIATLMSAKDNPADREAELFYRIGWFALMKTLVRFEKWNDLLDGKTLPSLDQPFESIWYHWAQGLAYASTSNPTAARNSLMQMEQSIRVLERLVNPIPHQFEVARAELAAYIDANTGSVKKGLDGLNHAAKEESELPYTDPTVYPRPVLELLGRTALHARDFQTAGSAYRRALQNEPGGGRALWGLAKALEGAGMNDEAAKTMEEYHRLWRGEELK